MLPPGQARRRTSCAVELIVLLAFIAACGSCLSADRSPVPSAAELKQLQASVKDAFKADIAAAKSGAQQGALAERMIADVQNDAASANSDYALLTQAQAIAIKAGPAHFGNPWRNR